MNPRFKPLISAPAEPPAGARSFQLKIVPAESTAAPFKPLSSVLPAAHNSPAQPAGASLTEAVTEPKLELKRQGDKVTRITVTCGCGCLHEIECEY